MSPSPGPRSCIEPARAVNHRRLLQLYVVAAQCYAAGRVDDAFGYLEASQKLTGSTDFDPDFHESQTSSGIAYAAAGHPQRWVEVCREAIARGPGPRTITRASLVMALNFLGDVDGAEGGRGRPARRGRGHHQSDYGLLRAIRAWSCAPQQ